MNLGPTTQPRTFHFMTMKGDHKLIDTVYAAKSLEEAVRRVVESDKTVLMKDLVADAILGMLKERGRIIYNSVQSVIIVHFLL